MKRLALARIFHDGTRHGISASEAVITGCRALVKFGLIILVGSCASYGPYHGNSASAPFNSVRGPADGRYKLAFIEFGDQGSALDTSQRKAALEVIGEAKRPLLFVYIHGWQNNANSTDVCKFEHFH